ARGMRSRSYAPPRPMTAASVRSTTSTAYTAQRRDVYLCAKRRGVPGERFSFVPAARSCIMFLSLLSWPTKRKAGISRRNPRGRLHLARHRFVPGVETLETRTVPNGGYVFSTLDAP